MNFSAPLATRARAFRAAPILCLAAVATWLGSAPVSLRAQSDDFNDGNDTGWSRYSPLAGFGVPGVFSFPSGGYRIQTTVPTGMANNPPRAGSVRQDITYSNFYASVDLVNWKDDTRQAFGLLARVGTPGFAQTTGYAFTYERGSGVTPTSGDTDISRITGEAPDGLKTGNIHLDPAKDYRMVFLGRDTFSGAILEGRIYQLPDLTTPIHTIEATDPSPYLSGYCGLVVYDNTGGGGVCDATFDNYFAAESEPPLIRILDQDFHSLKFFWPATATGYRFQSSSNLSAPVWTDVVPPPVEDDMGFFYVVVDSTTGNNFYRLIKP